MVSKSTFSCLQLSHTAKMFFRVLNCSQHVLVQNIKIRPCRQKIAIRVGSFITSICEANMSCGSLPGGWAASAWRWTVWCTDGRSAWMGRQARSPSGADQQALWHEPALHSPVGVLRYGWGGGPDRGLRMSSPGGREGPNWLHQSARVWQRDPWESRFHWSGLTEGWSHTSGQRRRRSQTWSY